MRILSPSLRAFPSTRDMADRSSTDASFDSLCRMFGVVMRPDTIHCPSRTNQQRIRVAVPLTIAFDLLAPPGGVRLRPRRVLWARVPEASIHEDCHTRSGEYHVGATPSGGNGIVVDAKAEPSTVQCRSQRDFGWRIPSLGRLHPAPDQGRRRRRPAHWAQWNGGSFRPR